MAKTILPTPVGATVLTKFQVASRCACHATTIMRWATDPAYADLNFPKPVRLGEARVGFLADEVDAWLRSRPRVTRGEAA